MKLHKTVHLAFASKAFKTVYYDWERAALRPDIVIVDADGSILFEINELGLKGDALDTSRKLALVWGDSVVFGHGRSWPCLLDAFMPGYQFLNGGIEGDPYDHILQRADAFNREHKVALNLLMLGWHPFCTSMPLPDMMPLRDALKRFLQAHPNTVLLTIPTALNNAIIGRDLSSFFTEGDDAHAFEPGFWPYTVGAQRALLAFVQARNHIVRELGAELNIRMIDLFTLYDTTARADFREQFQDMIHLRANAYPALAAFIHGQIADLL